MQTILLYDTTLRDGTQREGISLSVDDKIKISVELDNLGIHYIEGGWPGSNPKDVDYFRLICDVPLKQARVSAFGSTRKARTRCEDDPNIQALIEARTPVVTLFGKSSTLHVEKVIETTLEENLAMISESVACFKALDREVVYDAEHFFDGYRLNRDYALATLEAAAKAGADVLVPCDTNGGALPSFVTAAIRDIKDYFAQKNIPLPQLGIHTHNDGALALANALAAVEEGCIHVQGTINGYGERCGNMDLIPLIANLQLKLGYACVAPEQLRRLSAVSHYVAAVANLNPDDHAPFVGRSAFAHKGGTHVAAIAKVEESYQHIDPSLVGNEMRVVVSELSGRGNVLMRARAMGLKLNGNERDLVQHIKELENKGFQFEAAEGSFEMLIRRNDPAYQPPFELVDFTVIIEKRGSNEIYSQATTRVRIEDEMVLTAADGDGPVNALDRAIRKALLPHYPGLAEVKLVDFKVRIIDEHRGTAAVPRVLIESARGEERWSTIGASQNIIEASWMALWDSLELPLLRDRERQQGGVDSIKELVE
jgi:2-isopropylmalate synthase